MRSSGATQRPQRPDRRTLLGSASAARREDARLELLGEGRGLHAGLKDFRRASMAGLLRVLPPGTYSRADVFREGGAYVLASKMIFHE